MISRSMVATLAIALLTFGCGGGEEPKGAPKLKNESGLNLQSLPTPGSLDPAKKAARANIKTD